MKMYLISQKEMDDLHARLELCKLKEKEDFHPNSEKSIMASEMHRSFVYHVVSWMQEVCDVYKK